MNVAQASTAQGAAAGVAIAAVPRVTTQQRCCYGAGSNGVRSEAVGDYSTGAGLGRVTDHG